MRREAINVCLLLTKRRKQLFPLFLFTLTLIFIAQDQMRRYVRKFETRASTYIIQRQNSSSQLDQMTSPLHKFQTRASTYTIQRNNSFTQFSQIEYSINGERNAARTTEVCQKYRSLQQKFEINTRFNKNMILLYCPIYKVGTTFWRRVFMIEREKKYSNLTNPYELPFDKEYPPTKCIWKRNVTTTPYKVMFTRDPYNRLFSFFIDKLLAPNPYFWKTVGVQVIHK